MESSYIAKTYPAQICLLEIVYPISSKWKRGFSVKEMKFVVKFCHMLQLVPIMNGNTDLNKKKSFARKFFVPLRLCII